MVTVIYHQWRLKNSIFPAAYIFLNQIFTTFAIEIKGKYETMLVGCDVKDNKLIISYYNKRGIIDYKTISIPEEERYKWIPSMSETQFRTWDESYIQKVPALRYPRFRMEEMMIKLLKGRDRNEVFEYNKPIVAYLDIENYVDTKTNKCTKPELAEFPINLISTLIGNTVYVYTILPRLSDEQLAQMRTDLNQRFKDYVMVTDYNIVYKWFPTEALLLDTISHDLIPRIGFLTGWNVIEYDWQYIHNRCEKLGINFLQYCPIKETTGRFDLPIHMGVIDYIEAIKAFRPIKDLANTKLETVAKKTINIGKLENPYNSFSEYINDTYRFTLYNIIDVATIQQIEKKISMLELSFAVCNISQIEMSKIFSSVYMTEIFMCREFYNRGVCLPEVKKDNKKGPKYAGAYTECKRPGFFRYFMGLDFNSMYPNIGIEWNISPETYLGFADKADPAKLPSSFCKTAKNTLFDTTHMGVAPFLFKNYYDQRCDIQDEKRMYEKAIDEYEHKNKL